MNEICLDLIRRPKQLSADDIFSSIDCNDSTVLSHKGTRPSLQMSAQEIQRYKLVVLHTTSCFLGYTLCALFLYSIPIWCLHDGICWYLVFRSVSIIFFRCFVVCHNRYKAARQSSRGTYMVGGCT